jgi:hypothetical protein
MRTFARVTGARRGLTQRFMALKSAAFAVAWLLRRVDKLTTGAAFSEY